MCVDLQRRYALPEWRRSIPDTVQERRGTASCMKYLEIKYVSLKRALKSCYDNVTYSLYGRLFP